LLINCCVVVIIIIIIIIKDKDKGPASATNMPRRTYIRNTKHTLLHAVKQQMLLFVGKQFKIKYIAVVLAVLAAVYRLQ